MPRHKLIRAAIGSLSLAAPGRWPAARDCAGFVLTLHSVRPDARAPFAPNAVLAIAPDFLDALLAHLRARGRRFVSLDDLVHGDPDPRRIAITLDDGYRDNAALAAPVFAKHAAPYTIFACAGFADRVEPLWWEAVERVIRDAASVTAPVGGGTLPTRTPAEKTAAFMAWRSWVIGSAVHAEAREAIVALCRSHDFDPLAQAAALVMDWDEMKALARDPLCSIGAHTLTHPALARLPEEEAWCEMVESGRRIEARLGVRPTSVAFPYGMKSAAGSREARLAADAGFAASFTTQPGFVPAGGTRHGLPRVSVNGLFQKTRTYDVLLSSALWAMRGRMRGGAIEQRR